MTTITVRDHAAEARSFLGDSDREFEAGDIAQTSEKLRGAAAQAMIAIAQQRGWRHGSRRDLKIAVSRLAE